jgi:hypothetical protein
MRRIAAVAALPLVLAAALRQTIDGRPFPAAGPRVVDVRLPLSGRALGGLPEEMPARLYAIDGLADVVVGWRKQLVEHQVDTAGYDYIANGSDGARCVLVGLTDGRVSRLGYFFPGLTPEHAATLLRSLAAAGTDADIQGPAFRVTQNGVRILGCLTGSHRVAVTEYHPITMQDYNAGDTGATTRIDSYPSCIEIRIDPVDGYLAAHAPAPEIASDLREGRLAVGMSLLEARLAMACDGTPASADGAGEAYQWRPAPDVNYVAAFQAGRLVRFRREP